MLIMTDGQDNSSRNRMNWAEEWWRRNGLKSTFFAICQGDNEQNRRLAQNMNARYEVAGV